MKVAKWGNSLAIRIPADVARELRLEEGDEIDLCAFEGKIGIRRILTRDEAIEGMRRLAKPLPPGYKFDRDDANAR